MTLTAHGQPPGDSPGVPLGVEATGDLRRVLACPVCKGGLEFAAVTVACSSCGRAFPQSDRGWIDLMPRDLLAAEATWAQRQEVMESWYAELADAPGDAGQCFSKDYGPHAPTLSGLDGMVLDVGGGAGIARRYLPESSQYIVLDPSFTWDAPEWAALAEGPERPAGPTLFVAGVGEYLPFSADTIDAVLAFWSLNHAIRPADVVREALRVLRVGGLLYIVLEDMPPRWVDIPRALWRARRPGRAARLLADKLRELLPGGDWPLQTDHVRIQESDVESWVSLGCEIAARAWVGGYLSYTLRKVNGRSEPLTTAGPAGVSPVAGE
jgi:SAM-dependent methyltransferase